MKEKEGEGRRTSGTELPTRGDEKLASECTRLCHLIERGRLSVVLSDYLLWWRSCTIARRLFVLHILSHLFRAKCVLLLVSCW